MSLLGRIFGGGQDAWLQMAETLVQVSQVNAVGMYTPLLDRFAVLREADLEHWNFILTVAGVFMAATRLHNLGVSDKREAQLMAVVAEKLAKWNSDGPRAFEDCKRLFEREFDMLTASGHEAQFTASDAVGLWIVWNVLGRAPQTDEEVRLIRASGGLVTYAFFDWWDGSKHSS